MSLTGNPWMPGTDSADPAVGGGGQVKATVTAGKLSGALIDVPGMKPSDLVWYAHQHGAPSGSSPAVQDRTAAVTSIETDGLKFSGTDTDGGTPGVGGGDDKLVIIWLDRGL